MRLLVASAVIAGSLVVPSLALTGSRAAAPPQHAVVLTSSTGSITTWPTFDAAIDRFAVRPEQAISELTVTATSGDPGATVSVNGREAVNGRPLALPGLASGDEVNVQITDASGTSNQSWILLPVGFPALHATGDDPDLDDGMVFLTLASFLGSPFTALVDAHGVPTLALPGDRSDFKRSSADPERFSIAIPDAGGGNRIAEWDGQLRETRSHRLAGAPASTDAHDSILLSSGGAVLMGYDHVVRDGKSFIDAIIEVQDSAGHATLTWNSRDHVDAAVEALVDRSADDYAHINSLQQLDNGDIVASFRNLSQVMLIAGSDHDGVTKGDVVWRLGGLRNDFEFVGDPSGGPCAQHAAQFLANGHLLIFDNGSRRDDTGPIAPQTADMCPDGADPDGARVARPQSRVSEYALDTSTTPPTATLVWSHAPTGRYAPFAGNAQRLSDGNTLVGWSLSEVPPGESRPVATEVDANGEEIWSLTADGHFSYRAFKYEVPDRIAPEVTIGWPVDGAVLQQGAAAKADFSCLDTGGSNLDTCAGSIADANSLTARAGTHDLVVTGTDRNGNRTTRSVTYTVTPALTPPASPPTPTPTPTPLPTTTAPTPVTADVAIKKRGGRWKGEGRTRSKKQGVTLRTTSPGRGVARVRVRNTGGTAGRLTIAGSRSRPWSRVRWFAGTQDVTARVRAGTYRTRSLATGESVRLRLVVRVDRTRTQRSRTLTLTARNSDAGGRDAVRARLVVR